MGVELASSPPLFPRSCSRWLVLRIATPPPRAQLELLETLPRPPTLPLPRPTAISPPTPEGDCLHQGSLPGVHRLPCQEPPRRGCSEAGGQGLLASRRLMLLRMEM